MNAENKSFKRKMLFMLVVLTLIIMTIVVDGVFISSNTRQYQQFVIEQTELLDTPEKNLHDFQLRDNGILVSETDDPCIVYTLNGAMYIKSINISTEFVEPERRFAQVYLTLEDGSTVEQSFYIHSGSNTIIFNWTEEVLKVSAIRFDLLSQSNCSVKVNQVVINEIKTLAFKYHLGAFIIIFFILFTALFINKIFSTKSAKLQGFTTGVLLSAATSFLICVFAPLDMYFNNKSEFWFDVYTLLPILLIMFLATFFIGIIVLLMMFLLHERIYQIGVIFILIFLICSYIQGNFLVSNLPPLDGSSFEWADYSAERIKTLVLWFGVMFLVIGLLRCIHINKMYSVIKFVSGGLIGMLILTLGIECILTNGSQKKLDASITIKDQFEMSENENFIILVLDALDAGTFNDVLEQHQEYKQFFSDFTYYPDTMGAYSYTSRSIPFILSGEWFENKEPFENYNINIYKSSTLLSDFESKNYKLGMYETALPLFDKSIYRFSNVLECKTKITSYIDFIKLELMLTGFRYAPFDIKRFCMIYPNEFGLLREYKAEIPYQTFNASNLQLYSDTRTEGITYTTQNCFKFIHIEGAHVPYRYDKDVNIIIENGTYEQNIEASITITNAYLEKLKAADVYDNSVIIIMSDHGYIEGDDFEYGRQNPLFMVKGKFEHHDMQISQAPISYDDLQSAYIKLLNGETSDHIFDWKEGDERERRFLFYWYLDEDHMTEYIQTGDASDLTTMTPTGNKFDQ